LNSDKINNFIKIRSLLDIEGIGIIKLLRLVHVFGSIDNIFNINEKILHTDGNLNIELAKRINRATGNFDPFNTYFQNEIQQLETVNVEVITYWDENYPQQLKNIYYPPLILYILGKYKQEDEQSISIVGTRKSTDYGKSITNQFASNLAEQNITIISGMARGIDSIAHKAALKANGRTIAIVGSGLDYIYPPENKLLFNEITKNGAVISEFPLGTKPDAQNFPKRNRIIAGLSLGTLVIETKENGGAMQTAKFALDQNKEVFAIPGNLTSDKSRGTNILIQRNGAKLVTEPEDIIIELQLKLKPIVGQNIPNPKLDLSLFEEKIYQILNETPKQIDLVATESMLSISETLVNLLSLEFKGLVQQLPGKLFKRIRTTF
jgi:DNA processing protein